MNLDNAFLAQDLMIMEEMAANMADYLDSDVVDWTTPRADMPRLTIGGYLMRRRRLQMLKEQMAAEDQARLQAAAALFDGLLAERIVRFETRAHQELHKRIGEWIAIIRDLNRRAAAEAGHYAGVVDTRVVIKELLDILQTQPYQLEAGILDEIETVDRLLKGRLNEQPFIWDPLWEAAYPKQDYWWLYASPREI